MDANPMKRGCRDRTIKSAGDERGDAFRNGIEFARRRKKEEDRGAREIHDRPSLSSFSSDAKAYLRTRKSATSDGEAAMALLVCRSSTIIIHLPAIR